MEDKTKETIFPVSLLPEDLDRIEKIRKRYDLSSKRAAVRKALAILAFIVEKDAKVYPKDGQPELVIF